MADATATDTSGYDVKIEAIGAAKKRLTITVPASMINEKIDASMGTLATQTQLPGFRKGRAPKALLERRFGSTVRDETRNQVIADGYASAIRENDIKPVGDPEPVGKVEDLVVEHGKPFTFSVDVEVVPEFELPKLEGIEISKPVLELTDDHVESELKSQCAQVGEIKSIKSGFQAGDRIVGPGGVTKEGDDAPFFEHENIDIVLPEKDGPGRVLGLLVDGLDKLVAGKGVGDEVVIETVGPESHELEDVRGRKLKIEMKIREGQRLIPGPIERVLEQYGMDSEEILREQIRLALEQRRDEEQRAAMREQVNEALLEAVEFELPEKLTQAQAARLIERQRLEMLYRGGLSVEEVETRLAQMRAETEAQSRRRLRLSFILHKLGEHFEIGVTDQEINGRIAAIAAQRGERPEKLRQELLQSGAIGQIAAQIREHKAADRVIDKATIKEVDAEEWNRMRTEQLRSRSGEKTTSKKTTSKETPSKETTSKKTSTKKTSTKKTPAKKTSGAAGGSSKKKTTTKKKTSG